MTWASERAAIEERLENNWDETTIAYDNVDFVPPDNSAWIRLAIINGESFYHDLSGTKRNTGRIVIQLFTPLNQGTQSARENLDTLGDIFDSAEFEGIVCRETSFIRLGESQGWYQTNLTTPFWRDE